MWNYYLPVIIVVGSNIFYHICAKSIPKGLNPMVSLVVTYLAGAVLALALFYITSPSKDFIAQLKYVNWAPVILAFAIVGLEFGNIMLYRVGWNISIGSLVCNIALAVILIFIGLLFYKETITLNQFIGIGLCIAGLVFINK
ncbi:MAG: EamA family transporter [Anaerovoracaceae bacterium]|jgi:drug/metabolite transporter (DMT)-like permease